MRLVGLEPTRHKATLSRSVAATSYATVALNYTNWRDAQPLSRVDRFELSGDALLVLLFILLGIAVETGIS